MNTHDKYELPPLPEPDAYLFQHEETGLTEYVDSQQVEWGFEKANPRWQKIHGAFTERQLETYATAAIEADRQRRGEPDYFTYVINGHHRGISETMPPDDSYDEGTLSPLYIGPQPAESTELPSYKDEDDFHQNASTAELGAYQRGWNACREPTDLQPAAPVIKESLTVAEPVKVPSDGYTNEETAQSWYDLAWEAGARRNLSFDGDEIVSINFDMAEFESFCRALLDRYGSKS